MTKTTTMMMMTMAGLLMASPACGDELFAAATAGVKAVSAPSAPFATPEEMAPALTPMLPAPEVVERFIAHGVKHKDDNHALILRDSGQGFANAMAAFGAAQNGYVAQTKTGLWVEVFTPLSWVMQMAAAATREYRPFTLEAVTPELMEPVVRVIAHPDLPSHLTASGKAGTRSVQHVVLQDKSKQVTVQPLKTDPYDVPVANALGAREVYAGLTALFPLDQVLALHAKGEFYIVVVGTHGEKRFEVKAKHFKRLPLMPHMPAQALLQKEQEPCERPPSGIWPREKGVNYCR